MRCCKLVLPFIQLKRVATMKPGGRRRTVSALVVVGNKNGAVGT